MNTNRDKQKFKFRIFLNDNIVCKRNWKIKDGQVNIEQNYDDVIKMIRNYVNRDAAKFHHNVIIRFSYLDNVKEYETALHCPDYKIDIRDILNDIREKLNLTKL